MRGKNWTILKSHQDGTPPKEAPADQTLQFRLRDDDAEVYFEGVMVPTRTEELFAPLDDFGAAYGCTDVQIFEKGQWIIV